MITAAATVRHGDCDGVQAVQASSPQPAAIYKALGRRLMDRSSLLSLSPALFSLLQAPFSYAFILLSSAGQTFFATPFHD